MVKIDARDKLCVVIADRDAHELENLRRVLQEQNHVVAAEVTSGEALVEEVRRHRPNLVITEISLTGMDGLQAISTFSVHARTTVVVVSERIDQLSFERASACPVQAYLPKPFQPRGLAAAITVALQRFSDTLKLEHEVEVARRRLAEHADVEKAKGVLMRRAGIDEAMAYRRIRFLARESRQTIGQIAKSILLSDIALSDLEGAPPRSSH